MITTKGKEYSPKCFLIIFSIFLSTLCFNVYLHKEKTKTTLSLNKNISIKLKSSLLLGLKKNIDNNTVTYRTLWIAPDEQNTLRVMGELNFILLPHHDSFWKIEPLRFNFTNTDDFTQYLVSHSVFDDFTPKTFEYKFSTYNCILNFVDQDYVSVSTYRSYHRQSTESYTYKNCSVLKLEKLSDFKHNEDSISMQDIFKSKSIPIINKYKKSKIPLGECLEGNPINTTSGIDWTIGRNDGKWIPQIAETFKFSDNTSNNSDYILYNTSLELPKNIVSYNDLCSSIKSIKETIPEAEDAISSPEKDILGIFTSNKLTLYPYSSGSIGSPALTIDLDKGETMIMAQWADKSLTNEWNKTLGQFFIPK